MDNYKMVKRIVQRYKDMGIKLWVENEKLCFKAPKDNLNKDQLEFLKKHKEEIVKLLSNDEEDKKEFPLTDIQSAYLLGRMDSFDYGGISCQIYMEMEYEELDIEKTNYAWSELIKRHEILRSVIQADGYQCILDEVPEFTINFNDLSNEVNDEKLNEIRKKVIFKELEIGKWPFFNIEVSKVKDKYIMHIKFDFLIADWASIWILIGEFENIYEGFGSELEELDLTFEKYLELENNLKEEKKYIEDKKYWLDRIKDMPTEVSVPILEKNKLKSTFQRKVYEMNNNDWLKLKSEASRYGCTPTAIILAVYGLCIERWSSINNFVINLTLLNRLPIHPSVNKIVGDFTSVNLLEINLNDDDKFADCVKNIQKQMLKDLDHRSFSGVKVLREIRRQEGKEETIFPYVFTSSIGLMDDKNIKGNIGQYGISQTPQVFIDCQAMDSSNGLRINWDIREGVFKEGVVEDMFNAFCNFLDKLVKHKTIWEKTAQISLPKNQVEVRKKANNTERAIAYESLHESIIKQIENNKESIAIIDKNGETTYEQLGKLAKEISFMLKEKGCSKGDKVGIIIPKGSKQVAAVLGVLINGDVYVPIDDKQPIDRINKIIETANINAVITHSNFDYKLLNCNEKILVDKLKINNDDIASVKICESKCEDLAYIIFTSGSTGSPKGVQITHGAANNTIKDINYRFNISKNDSVLSLSKLSFDLSVYDIFGLLSAGGKIVFPNEDLYLDVAHWSELVEKNSVTVWNTVPSFMQMYLSYVQERKIKKLPLKTVLLSGDWIPVTMGENIWKYNKDTKVVGLGGATEAAIWSNYHILNEDDSNKLSIPYGYPLSNQTYKVLNNKNEDCPDWVSGELYILGEGLSKGYINDEIKTKESFIIDESSGDRLYKTGDYGYYMPNGEIVFLGRKDDQVKLRGYRIELGEIENVLKKNKKIKNACAVICGEEHKNIFVVVTLNSDITVDEIEEYLSKKLPKYMMPTAIKIVDKIDFTSNGKVDKKIIYKYYDEYKKDRKVNTFVNSDNGKLEKKLIEILEEFLGSTSITSESNIYDFGADSLIIAQYVRKIKEVLEAEYLGKEFSFDGLLRQILNVPRINKLAEYIGELINKSGSTNKVNEDMKEDKKHIGLFSQYGGGEDGPARLVFHAGLGTMNCFRYLLKHLDEQKLGPVIGVTVQDINKYCSIDCESLIEEIADDYSKQIAENKIKEVQLIGYCMGGLIALEVARRLSDLDVEIKDFTLIDSAPVYYDIDPCIAIELVFITNFYITVEQVYEGITNDELMDAIIFIFKENNNSLKQEYLWQLKNYDKYKKSYEFFKEILSFSTEKRFQDYAHAIEKVTGESVPIEMLTNNYKLYVHSFKASRFKPMEYFGDIRFLQAKEKMDFIFTDMEETRDFWSNICIGDLEVLPIDGNHITCIENEKNAAELAKLVAMPLLK